MISQVGCTKDLIFNYNSLFFSLIYGVSKHFIFFTFDKKNKQKISFIIHHYIDFFMIKKEGEYYVVEDG